MERRADNCCPKVSFHRKLMKSHTLSDGKVLSPSTYVAVASAPMAVSSLYHSSPDTFNGFRFHLQRQESGDGSMSAHQITSTGPGTLMFGHGKYACPGRFFASLEVKLILTHIIRHYDLKLVHGAAGRPGNLYFADANLPDAGQVILFRRRS